MSAQGVRISHAVALRGEVRPAAHGTLAVAPVFGLKRPRRQPSQSSLEVRAPRALAKRPAMHRLPQATVRPVVLLHVPRAHRRHCALLVRPVVLLHFPREQLPVQRELSVFPVDASSWNDPATHSPVQRELSVFPTEPSCWYAPARHRPEQRELFVFPVDWSSWYVPAMHAPVHLESSKFPTEASC